MDVSSVSGFQTGPQVVVQGTSQPQAQAEPATQQQPEPVEAKAELQSTERVSDSREVAASQDESLGRYVDTQA